MVSSNKALQCQPFVFSAPSLVFSAMTNAPTENTTSARGAVAMSENTPVRLRWIVSVRFAAMVASPNCAKLHRVSAPPV